MTLLMIALLLFAGIGFFAVFFKLIEVFEKI